MIDNLFKITALIAVTSSTIQSIYIDRLELITIIKQEIEIQYILKL